MEQTTLAGFEVWDLLEAFNLPGDEDVILTLGRRIWVALIGHPMFTEDDTADWVVVSWGWFRRFAAHVAVDRDALEQFVTKCPKLDDRELVFIRKAR